MQHLQLAAAFAASVAFTLPVVASAGSSSHTSGTYAAQGCMTGGKNTCPPGKPTEKIVPQYFSVPSKTKHIYYDRPQVSIPTTAIIHHVPVPVYDGPNTIEKVQGGQWHGPALGCCQPQTPTHYVPPTVQYAPPAPQVYCYKGSKSRYDHRGRRVQAHGCR